MSYQDGSVSVVSKPSHWRAKHRICDTYTVLNKAMELAAKVFEDQSQFMEAVKSFSSDVPSLDSFMKSLVVELSLSPEDRALRRERRDKDEYCD
jgi:hypothetical protein